MLPNLDDNLLFDLDDNQETHVARHQPHQHAVQDEFDNITLNLDVKLLNGVYDILDILYNCQRLSGTYRESQQRAVERFSILGAGAGWANTF